MSARWSSTILLLLMVSPPLGAEVFPSHQRGLSADTAYGHYADVDSINFFNGNLTLSLPIGQTYAVGPSLSYGLTLSFNSNVWEYETGLSCVDPNNATHRYALPYADPTANAGFGWRLGMGRIIAGYYESPDGGKHTWSADLHPQQPSDSAFYTTDGTYLRLRNLSSGCATTSPCSVVEFPDGRIQEFRNFGDPLGEMRLVQIRDQFGHTVDITYGTNLWTITDEHGRVQKVHFSDGRVSSVELTAFGNTTAEWEFEYDLDQSIQRSDFTSKCQLVPTFQTVDLLRRVIMPGGHFYEMDYIHSGLGSGAIESLRLPTGGKVAWEYGDYYFVSIQGPPAADGYPWSRSTGVTKRRTYLSANDPTPHGEWTYSQEQQGFHQATGDPPWAPCRSRTLVKDPEGHETEYFFSTTYNVKRWSYALPFSWCHPDSGAFSSTGPFVSQRIYKGSVAPSNLLREIQVEYESDGNALASQQERNHRLKRQKVVFKDDDDHFRETVYSDFDGMGHYRTVTTSGNFFGNTTKVATTRYNPQLGSWAIDPDTGQVSGAFTMPAVSSPWVWNTYTQREETQGSSYFRSDYCFDARGYLEWQRSLAGSSPANHDLLTVMDEEGDSGHVAAELHFGGDGWPTFDNSYSVDTPCATMNLPAVEPSYRIEHDYSFGVPSRSVAVEPCHTSEEVLETLRQDIDAKTGLPSAIYDPAGVKTVLLYDALGRLVAERPEDSGWKRYVFALPTTGSPSLTPRYTIEVCANGATSCPGAGALSWAESTYDGLGRRVTEAIRYPGSSGSTLESRTFEYNALGWKLTESSWGDPGLVTTWSDHDRFGRPGWVQLPGKNPETELKYIGDRVALRRDRIVTGFSGQDTSAYKAELKDHFGRLIEVCEGMANWWDDSCNADVTGYRYDARDRIVRVCADSNSGCQQERLFSFDGRGFLISERHPEIGAAGNSLTSYTYDARGNVLRKTIAGDTSDAFSLDYRYDRAGRLVRVSNNGEPLKEFHFARTNEAGDLRRGKLVRAVRHNYVGPVQPHAPEGIIDFVVSDTYRYGGLDGRVSEKSTAVGFNTGTRLFQMSEAHDALGNISSQTWPECVGWPCQDEDPSRTVGYTYTNGFLTAIPGFASSLDYQLGGALLREVETENGVTWLQEFRTTDRVVRPSRIGTSDVQAGQNWSTGDFDYDGVWNIHQMGNAGFKYDVFNRLREGQVDLGSGLVSQEATYDRFGNILSLKTNNVTRTIGVHGASNRLSTGATYDVAGNLVGYSDADEQLSYGWDPLGSMESLRSNRNLAALYIYDANDDRIFTWTCPQSSCGVGSAHERYTLRGLGGEVLRAFEGTSSHDLHWQEDFIYRGRQLLANVRATSGGGTETFFIHPDHLGSTRQVTNAAGAQVKRHHFYPFGEEASTVGTSDVSLKFTGHQRDQNKNDQSTLDYMRARSHSPTLARFLSVDPARSSDPRSPQSWNRYAYTQGNPVKYRDPDGRATELNEAIAGGLEQAGAFLSEFGDALNQGGVVGIGADTTLGTVGTIIGGMGDMFRAGDAVGEAVGSGASGEDLTRAIAKDVGRTSALVLTVAGPATGSLNVPNVTTSRVLLRSDRSLQKFFTKHGEDFGLTGNWNPARAADASRALHQHINGSSVRQITGFYRGQPVTYYLDPATGLNVIEGVGGNFVSGWRLSAEQLKSVLSTGRLF